MKKILRVLICFMSSSYLVAADMNTQKIMEVLKNANAQTEQVVQEPEKSPMQVREELQNQKQIEDLRASQGQFDNVSLNKRIDNIKKIYQSKINSIGSYSIKIFGKYEECEKEQCVTYAIVNETDFNQALTLLKENSKGNLESMLTMVEALRSIRPLVSKQTKIENLENQILTSSMSEKGSFSNIQNISPSMNNRSLSLANGEVINGKYKVTINNNKLEINEELKKNFKK